MSTLLGLNHSLLSGHCRDAARADPRLPSTRPNPTAAQLRDEAEATPHVESQIQQVCVGIADVRCAPSPDAPLETQALYGETVTLYEDHEGFGHVELESDGYVGFVSMAALAPPFGTPTHRVAVSRTFVYPGPDLKLPPRDALPLGASVCVASMSGAFAKVDDCAFVFAGHLASMDAKEPDYVTVAERFLHAPYLWGGKTSLGIDCSGLVQVSLQACGIRAPRNTSPQCQALGNYVDTGAAAPLKRGDLIFWHGHVGIMRDAVTLLHANAHHMMVASEPLASARERILASTSQDIAAIKRLDVFRG